MSVTLTPAYGRDYKSKAAVLKDFNDNKDFVIASINNPYCGKYATRADLTVGGVKQVSIRYGKLMKVVLVDL